MTNTNGIADFGLVQVRGDSGEAEQKISVEVEPSKTYAGWRDFVDKTENSFTVKVETGTTASGSVIDVKTGNPVPNTVVTAYPADFNSTNYYGHLKTRTDKAGRFTFRGMQDIRYRVSVPSAAPADAVVTKLPNGGRRYKYPNGSTEQIVIGGSEDDHEIHVQVVD